MRIAESKETDFNRLQLVIHFVYPQALMSSRFLLPITHHATRGNFKVWQQVAQIKQIDTERVIGIIQHVPPIFQRY